MNTKKYKYRRLNPLAGSMSKRELGLGSFLADTGKALASTASMGTYQPEFNDPALGNTVGAIANIGGTVGLGPAFQLGNMAMGATGLEIKAMGGPTDPPKSLPGIDYTMNPISAPDSGLPSVSPDSVRTSMVDDRLMINYQGQDYTVPEFGQNYRMDMRPITQPYYGTGPVNFFPDGRRKMGGGGYAVVPGRYPMQNGGDLTEINAGGTHEENPLGGVPVTPNASVEQGETIKDDFVFSDRLKLNKTLVAEFALPKKYAGKTFAEASKILEKYNNHNDHIAKRTNEQMSDRLKTAQEAYKMASGPQMAYGGRMRKPYSNGGNIDPDLITSLQASNFDEAQIARLIANPAILEAWAKVGQSAKQFPTANEDFVALTKQWANTDYTPSPLFDNTSSISGTPKTSTPITPTSDGPTPYDGKSLADFSHQQFASNEGRSKSIPFMEQVGNTLNTAAPYLEAAPILYNTIQGLRKPEQFNKSDYMATNNVRPQTFNIEPQRKDLRDAFTSSSRLVSNAAAGNSGAYLSNLSSLYDRYSGANENLFAQKENFENKSIQDSQLAANRVGQFNSQIGFNVDTANQANRDASRNLLGAAASQLGQIGSRANTQNYYKDLYKLSSPNVYDYGYRAYGGQIIK